MTNQSSINPQADAMRNLTAAVDQLIRTHSASQLIPYEGFLREFFNVVPILADYEDIFMEIGIAKAENAAFMVGVCDEPYEDDDECCW